MKTIVIVNPQAGNGRTEKIWPNIESALVNSIGSFEVLQTTCRGDATDLSYRILKEDVIFISESHYLVSLIKTQQYDTIYHEHLRYYSLNSLKYLFEKHGLKIIHAKKISPHGGSIRVYATKSKKFKINKSVNKILKHEKKFLNWNTFNKFKKEVVQSKIDLYSLLKRIKKQNKRILIKHSEYCQTKTDSPLP